jgi:hypothetical protein
MLSINIFIFILVIHFLADFALQTHEQAQKKSESNKWLTYHVTTYSVTWLVSMLFFTNSIPLAISFACITFLCHWATDWATSRIGKPFWKNNDFHNGFVVVGADQVLHYIQLIYTYYLLTNY